MIYMIESHLNYLASALETIERSGIARFEVRPEAQQAYNARLQEQMQRTIWQTGGCASWYLDKHGNNTTLWPSFTFVFRQLTRRFDVDAYDTESVGSRRSERIGGMTELARSSMGPARRLRPTKEDA
jgi:hypothetical protein